MTKVIGGATQEPQGARNSCIGAPRGQIGEPSGPAPRAAGRLLQNVGGVVLVDEHRRQGDQRAGFFAVQELDRLSETLGAWRCVEEGRGQLPFVHPGDALVRKRVDADEELDVLVTSGVLRGEIGAVSHRIVVAVDEVDLLVVAQRRGHDVVGLDPASSRPTGREQYLIPGSLSVKAWKPSCRSCAGWVPMRPNFDDIAGRLAGAAEQLHRIFAGRPANQRVVPADELGDPLGVDVAVEHDDRNFGVDRLFDHAGQPADLWARSAGR